jgi:hypothetical protein
MTPASHQTITLSTGKHLSADEGACVMELASLLAGGPFTDRPVCACPVIAAFLREYNDRVDDHRRQDLYRYASIIVGTRSTPAVEQARAERLGAWSAEMYTRRCARFMPLLIARALSHLRSAPPAVDARGAHAVSSIGKHTPQTHRAALGLIEELVTTGAKDPHPVRAMTASPSKPRFDDEWIQQKSSSAGWLSTTRSR